MHFNRMQGIVASFRASPRAWFSALMASGDTCGYIGPQQPPGRGDPPREVAAAGSTPGVGGDDAVASWQLSCSCSITPSQWLLLVAVSAPTRCGAGHVFDFGFVRCGMGCGVSFHKARAVMNVRISTGSIKVMYTIPFLQHSHFTLDNPFA